MPDQADDLRRFVAEQKVPEFDTQTEAGAKAYIRSLGLHLDTGKSPELQDDLFDAMSDFEEAIGNASYHRLTSLPPETAEVCRAKLKRPAPPSMTDDLITYRRLWLDLKNEALADVLRPSVSSIQTNTDRYNRMERKADEAHRLYDRMEQAETLAFYAHVPPATPETWEAVRDGLRGKG